MLIENASDVQLSLLDHHHHAHHHQSPYNPNMTVPVNHPLNVPPPPPPSSQPPMEDVPAQEPFLDRTDLSPPPSLPSSHGSTATFSEHASLSSSVLDFAPGLQLSWHDLSFTASRRTSWLPCRPKEKKVLIKDLNGTIRNGQLTAIMGPSGCGKSTFIECLAGRRKQGVSGDLRVNYKK